MLQINDDINDELFRRAAESYPLRTDNPDWDAVLNKMNSENPSSGNEPIAKKRNNNYRFLLLLLLLIPFAIFENKKPLMNEWFAGQNNGPAKATIEKEAPAHTNFGKATNDNTAQSINQVNQQEKNEMINPAEPVKQVIAQTITGKNNDPVSITTATEDNLVTASNKRTYSTKQKTRMSMQNAQASTTDEDIANNSVAKEKLAKKRTTPASTAIAITKGNEENDLVVKKETGSTDKNEVVQPEKEIPAKNTDAKNDPVNKDRSVTPQDKSITPELKTREPEKEVAKNNDKAASKENKKSKTSTKHFYVGLVAAPDLSTVKLQSLKKVGLNYGLLVGYRITKKLSIETGLLQDRKYYSSNGQYFSTKNIYLPTNASIEYVNGVCKMLEMPVNISYAFRKGKRSGLFGSVGMSSYFMQHESYVYDVNYNGYRYPKAYDYSNKSTSILAVINISAGYTYKLGKIGDLRFEPYIKLPVSKIGTGNLPIQSGGIFIGFTKDIF